MAFTVFDIRRGHVARSASQKCRKVKPIVNDAGLTSRSWWARSSRWVDQDVDITRNWLMGAANVLVEVVTHVVAVDYHVCWQRDLAGSCVVGAGRREIE